MYEQLMELPKENLVLMAMGTSAALYVGLLLLNLVLSLSWNWVNDKKESSFLFLTVVTKQLYGWKLNKQGTAFTKKDHYSTNDVDGAIIGTTLLAGLTPLALLVLYNFSTFFMIIGVLIVIAHVARLAIRQKKLLTTHLKDHK